VNRGDIYSFLDIVVGLQLRPKSLTGSLARPQLPDDEDVGNGHDDNWQEEEHCRDEAVVSRA